MTITSLSRGMTDGTCRVLGVLLVVTCLTGSARAQVNEADSLALVALYQATTADGPWDHATGFAQAVDNDPDNDLPLSQWATREPVVIENGRVAHVDLWGNNLNGTLPDAICDLEALRELDLDLNKLTGMLPSCIGNMAALEKLSIRQINFDLEGTLPESLGDLANLEELNMPGHAFTGPLPASLGNLANLEILILGGTAGLAGNQLNGPIPASLGQLANLAVLNLRGNKLGSSIPASLGNLTNLTVLDARFNELSGTVPAALDGMTSLETLRLAGNALTDFEEGTYDGWTSLAVLEVNNNALTNIPVLSGLPALGTLNVSRNALRFDDLEPLAGLVNQIDFSYEAQAVVELRVTDDFGLSRLWMDAGGEETTYEWLYREDTSTPFETIEGETGPSILADLNGLYTSRAHNPLFPDLTLFSTVVDVEANVCKTGAACEVIVVNSTGDQKRGTDDDGTLLPGCDTGEMIDRDGQEEPECTLRAAIELVNAGTGKATDDPSVIEFFIPGDGTPVIQLREELPEITQPVVIDGTTQLIFIDGTPQPDGLVRIDGQEVQKAIGLALKTNGSTIKGLSVEGFHGAAIEVVGSDNRIEENILVGNDAGMSLFGDKQHGESRNNRIQRNVIGANKIGLFLLGLVHENTVDGNFIGVQQDGVTPLSNSVGILIIGIGPEGNKIINNVISNNDEQGIKIKAVKDTQVQNNIISGNKGTGLLLNGAINTRVEGNYVGTNEEGVSGLGNEQDGIRVKSSIKTHIEGNIIVANHINGILLKERGTEAEVVRNAIGVYVTPEATSNLLPKPLGNGGCGVRIEKEHTVLIEENIILANSARGVCAFNVTGSLELWSNLIGLKETIQGPVGNQGSGVYLEDVHEGILVQNSIVFNGQDGVEVSKGDEVVMLSNVISENNQAGVRARDAGGIILYLGELARNKGNGTGIHLTNTQAEIRGATIIDDAGDAITLEDGSTASVTGNNIVGNAGMGLNNLTPTVMVTASDNWWGDASGPGGQGPGSGDAVSDGVDFSDWLGEMVAVVIGVEADEILLPTGEADTVSVFLQNWQHRDDVLDLTITDTEGWLQGPATLAVTLDDTTGAEARLAVAVPGGTPNGTATTVEVTATSQADASHTATTTFTLVAESAALAQVIVAPDAVEVAPGDTVLFAAFGLDQFSRAVEIAPTWSATGGAIDTNGVYVAGAATGEFVVTATDPATGLSGTARVGNGVAVAVEEADDVPEAFRLDPNYPNPFNPETTIAFTLPQHTHVRLVVYDVLGREVVVLVDEALPAGTHQTRFDAGRLASGVYVYRMTAGSFRHTRTMVLLR